MCDIWKVIGYIGLSITSTGWTVEKIVTKCKKLIKNAIKEGMLSIQVRKSPLGREVLLVGNNDFWKDACSAAQILY